MINVTRRRALSYLGVAAASGAGLFVRRGVAAPSVAKGTVLTVSTWGGVTQDAIAKHAGPEFTKASGATIAFDIGSQGPRYSKMLAQRAAPSTDVFFGSDESLVSGLKAGVLTPVRRKNLSNLPDIEKWALTVPSPTGNDTVGGIPYGLIAYMIGYNSKVVKKPITSWGDLWRPEFAGKFAYASPFHSMMPALLVIASELAGGSMDNVDPGFKKLAELRPAKLQFTWTGWAALYQSGDVTMATEFDCYLDVMKNEKYVIETVVPKEKGLACIDGMGIVKGRPNQELAEFFLDTIASPAVQTGLSQDLFQGPINSKVVLPADLKAKCNCGANAADLRFFDPVPFAKLRPAWTERMMTEVVPKWGAH